MSSSSRTTPSKIAIVLGSALFALAALGGCSAEKQEELAAQIGAAVDSLFSGDSASEPALPGTAAAAVPESAPGAKRAAAPAEGLSLTGEDASKNLYYQFVDARGRVRFVDRFDDVPPEWRSKVGYVAMDTPPPLSPAHAQQLYAERQAPSLQLASLSSDVILYSADWCGWCKKAKSWLDDNGTDYQERDIDVPSILAELVQKTGQKGVPALDVDGRIVTGFSPNRYADLL